MNFLFWVPPWPSQDDPVFFRNSTEKFLVRQANMLAIAGHKVDFILPAAYGHLADLLEHKKVRVLTPDPALARLGGSDIYERLYQSGPSDLTRDVISVLKPILAPDYDAIFLWETPAPFLAELYPDIPILHQMPGSMAREPYAHTITVDPEGLYRDGLMHRDADLIQTTSCATVEDDRRIGDYIALTQALITGGDDSGLADLLSAEENRFTSYWLLPMQVSKHYAFRHDTKLNSQVDLLLEALRICPPDTGLIATQYVHRLVTERVLTPEGAASLRSQYPNLIFSEQFDRVESVSQKILDHMDRVVTASSSIGVQALAHGVALKVPYPTFLEPYDADRVLDGVRWEDRCRHTRGFVLGRYQPLAEMMRDDAGFVVELVQRLAEWKRDPDRSALTLPSFAEIRPDYWDQLFAGIRTMPQKTEKKAKAEGAARGLDIFSRRISPKSVVSFDIFDTLVNRPIEKPGDLYKFLEPEVYRLTNGKISQFARIRVACELACRDIKAAEGKDHDEILLDDIYGEMKRQYALDDAVLEQIKQVEQRMEIDMCGPRAYGMKLFEIAKAQGKRIQLISDMYLPNETIQAIVDNCGITGYEKLYLSADIGLRKHTGKLFTYVLEDLGITADDLLHVGDNINSDIRQAESLGIEPFRWSTAIERIRRNKLYKSIYDPRGGAGHRARSAIAGLTARDLFDSAETPLELETLFAGDPGKMGYAALGPMMVGYVTWLCREAKRTGISDLYFLSREGFLLKQVYEILFDGDPDAPKAHYFYTSRRCVRIAALRAQDDLIDLAAQPYDPSVKLSNLFRGRFGIALDPVTDLALVKEFGFRDIDDKVPNDTSTKMKFVQLALRKGPEILENAAAERAAYESYVAGTGLLKSRAPGVVDIGWKANIQGALGELLGMKMPGFYYAVTEDGILWANRGFTHHSFLGPYIAEAVSPSAVLKNRHLLEHLVCHTDPTLLHFEMEGDRAVPVFKAEPDRYTRKAFVGPVHEGTLKFARAFRDEFGALKDDFVLDPYLCERVFAAFVTAPTAADHALLEGQMFEDVMGGISGKKIAPQMAPAKPAAKAAGAKPAKAAPAAAQPIPAAQNATLLKLENKLVRRMVSTKKYSKYRNNRRQFFEDAGPLGLPWLRISGSL